MIHLNNLKNDYDAQSTKFMFDTLVNKMMKQNKQQKSITISSSHFDEDNGKNHLTISFTAIFPPLFQNITLSKSLWSWHAYFIISTHSTSQLN